jgi:hypothetical protein
VKRVAASQFEEGPRLLVMADHHAARAVDPEQLHVLIDNEGRSRICLEDVVRSAVQSPSVFSVRHIAR